jgi:arsenate reductase-like glutaredoxin family protein
MVSYKKRFQSEKEIERMLQESGSEGDSIFSDSEKVFKVKVKAKVKVKTIQKKVQQKILKQVMKLRHQLRKKQTKRVGSGL